MTAVRLRGVYFSTTGIHVDVGVRAGGADVDGGAGEPPHIGQQMLLSMAGLIVRMPTDRAGSTVASAAAH